MAILASSIEANGMLTPGACPQEFWVGTPGLQDRANPTRGVRPTGGLVRAHVEETHDRHVGGNRVTVDHEFVP